MCIWACTVIWLAFSALYFATLPFSHLIGVTDPSPMEIFYLKMLFAYCFFLGLATGSVAWLGDRRANQALLAAQLTMAAFFATVVYPILIPEAGIPYFGTPAYYVIWSTWVGPLVTFSLALAADLKEHPLSSKPASLV